MLAWMLVFARTADPDPLVGNFVVPTDTPGIEIVETWDHLGMRATGSHDVRFADALIPAAHAVDVRPPTGWATRRRGPCAPRRSRGSATPRATGGSGRCCCSRR